MNNILIVSGHTDLKNSIANKTILGELSNKLPEAEFDYLDTLYSDYKFDVEVEQEKLIKADVIVLQFPLYWYGMTSLMNKWMEDVFEHGFSHGSKGDRLKGKKIIASFTTGAAEELYSPDAMMGFEIEAFLAPIKAACNLCGMEFAGFVYTGGVSYNSRSDEDALAKMTAKSVKHADRVIEIVNRLQ